MATFGECPKCHGKVELILRGGEYVISSHKDEKGGECNGEGDPPKRGSLSGDHESYKPGPGDSGGFGGGMSE